MKIEVKCRHASFSDALRAYAVEQVEGLDNHGFALERAEIVLDHGREGLCCEVLVHPRHGDPLVAKDVSHDARAAVDGAVAKMAAQVARAKDRRDDRRRAAS
jgi:ribosomal subunit interface protein